MPVDVERFEDFLFDQESKHMIIQPCCSYDFIIMVSPE